MDEARLRRIGFVTRHYGALRAGVSRAVAVPMIGAVGALQMLLEYIDPPKVIGLILGLANIFGFAALTIVAWLWSKRWLDRRFGRVQSSSPLLTLAGIVFCQVSYLAASRMDDSYGAGVGLPSFKFLLIAAVATWCAARLWPYSMHYLLVGACAAGMAMPYATLVSEQAVDLWELRAFAAVLVAWAAAGLIDLAIISKVLSGRSAGEPVADDA